MSLLREQKASILHRLLAVVAKRVYVTFSIGVEAELCSVASAAENENTSVVIVELGSNTVDRLGDSLSRRIVAVGDTPSNTTIRVTDRGMSPVYFLCHPKYLKRILCTLKQFYV